MSSITTPYPATSTSDEWMEAQHAKQTITLNLSDGPLVVDVWEPRRKSDDLPILLVHGWGGSGSYWARTAHALSETALVIVPDLPGTGRSQPVRKAQSMFDQTDALASVLDEFELAQVNVVGHSMGSAMSLLLTDKYPDRVSRLILTSLAFFLNETQQQIYKTVMGAFNVVMGFRPNWLVNVPGLSYAMASRYFYRVPRDERVLRQGFLDYLELDAATARKCADDAVSPAIPEAGARIQTLTLLIACRQDRVMPVNNVAYTVDTIPNCQLHWIEKCGHLPMVEKPDEYLAVVRAFLALSVPAATE